MSVADPIHTIRYRVVNGKLSSLTTFTCIQHSLPLTVPCSLLPIVGQYEISDVANMTVELYRRFGKIVRLTGLIGRPDLLFVNDADEIEKVGHHRVTMMITILLIHLLTYHLNLPSHC